MWTTGALKKVDIKPEQVDEIYFGNVLSAGLGRSFSFVMDKGMHEQHRSACCSFTAAPHTFFCC
jgi:hypothetical protein